MDRDIDSRAGYKHHLTKEYLQYLQEEVMKLCKREGLHQVDLLSPAGTKITEKEYRAKENGQRKLDKLNEEIIAAQMKPASTVFQTQKQYLRDAIQDAASQAVSPEEFETLLKEKYGIELKDRRERYSYLHPDRKKHITGRALGTDYEKESLLKRILMNKQKKRRPLKMKNLQRAFRRVLSLFLIILQIMKKKMEKAKAMMDVRLENPWKIHFCQDSAMYKLHMILLMIIMRTLSRSCLSTQSSVW